MGLIFLFIVLLLIFISMAIIGGVVEGTESSLFITGVCLGVLALTAVFICSMCAIFTQAYIEADYQKMLLRKEVIEFRIEHEDNVVIPYENGSDNLYDAISKFNNEILDTRTYKDNWFIGVFYNYKIATIDYIDLGDYLNDN